MSGRLAGRVRRASRGEALLVAALLGLAALAWAVTGQLAEPHMRFGLLTGAGEMRGQGGGAGSTLTVLGLFLVTWTVMMVAMMLPSALPAVVTYDRWAQRTGRSRGATLLFVSGYLLSWAAAGVVAYLLIVHLVPLLPTGDTGVRLGAAVLVVAGVYQFTPLKRACLRQCRSPMAFIAAYAAPLQAGPLARMRVGAAHGAYCLGCCWALMAVLLLLGMMSLTWMALVAAVVLVEKVLPHGGLVSGIIGGVLTAVGLVLLVGATALPVLA
ncbi:DUF2182 domain-containing protein [Salinactinospora qingdaonensis]|uniref:Metal-binding membrane protein n=1 Tax=Salinactinospora qingdaonensis TaxID=702744 RepID=A0ABP7FMZ9_9ACTN